MDEINNVGELTVSAEQHMEVRPIEVITAEIWLYKQQAGAAILEIGRRLNEAKAQLSHGEWLPWLEEKVEFSEATAQRFMRLAREYENPSLVTDLGASKALQLLALPASERDEFIAEKHEVGGQEKTVLEMSKRELAQAIKERDEARKKAAEMEKTMEEQLEAAENRVEGYAKELKAAKEKAAADMEKAQRDIDSLKAELEEVAAGPAAVAVETVVDEEAVKAAAEAAREKTAAELKTKIEKAEKAKERAEQAKAKAEQDLAAVKVAQEEAQAVANREKQAMAEQVQDLQKKLAVASSSEMTIFKLHFEQGQTSINKMSDCITNMAEAGDVEGAEKLKNALRALLNSTLEVLR